LRPKNRFFGKKKAGEATQIPESTVKLAYFSEKKGDIFHFFTNILRFESKK